ncbi:lipocalin family protein, partial [Aeromonas sp. HMWF016]
LNRGKQSDGSWREAEGKAYFVGSPDEARLKVSFFGPFYGGYNVIDLDPDYQLSLVTSYNHDYLWILSRSPNPPKAKVDALVAKAKSLGFATDQLIWVKQSH